MTGADVKARVVHYEGGDIVLNNNGKVMTVHDFPALADYIGQTLVVTDTGTEILTVPSSGELILGGKVPQSVTN